MNNKHLLYTRRHKEVRGPFPIKMISRYILLGRVLDTDEISSDQRNWKLVSAVPELIPEELKADLAIPENREKLRLARLREDEREYGDRRTTEGEDVSDDIRRRRSGEERRESESMEAMRHRRIKTETSQLIAVSNENYRVRFLAVVTIIVVIIGVIAMLSPKREIITNNCATAARPLVNWSNCRFEAMQLNGANLQGATLQNTFLISASLRGANLTEAQMSYSNLANADMRDSNLSNTKLLGAVLRKADLNAANLRNSDLSFAILHEADLTNADFSNANLTNVVLNGAIIANTNFSGAILDKAIWTDNTVCAPESIGKCIPVKARVED